mmetsp:Transcript_61921/g.191728  ORF Transcript_61921/g.191728 Transcript_61921/m.191728 type:complete len:224 (+) Transcript_61921:33-704(+)
MKARTPSGTRPSMICSPSRLSAASRKLLFRISVEERLPSTNERPSGIFNHDKRGPNLARPVGSSGDRATSKPGRCTTRKSNSFSSLSPATTVFVSSGSPGFQALFAARHEEMFVVGISQSEPMTKLKSTSGCLSRNVQSKSYVKKADSAKHSMSLTFTGKAGVKAVLTAIWHMQYLSIGDVFSFGLSGRGPQGTNHTSSAQALWTISAAEVMCALVGGSNAPP